MEQIIRIAMICHHSSERHRKHLGLSNDSFRGMIRRCIGHPYEDYAPWVYSFVDGIKELTNVDFHIVAPHVDVSNEIAEFSEGCVQFHVFNPNGGIFSTIQRLLTTPSEDEIANRNAMKIKGIINKIKPDLVLVLGAENAYYSKSILSISDVPTAVLCQTVYSNPQRLKSGEKVNQYRWDIEQEIFKHVHYYFCLGKMHHDLVVKYVPNAVVFNYNFPPVQFPRLKEIPKTTDFVFFAQRVIASKGIECSLRALGIVKKKKPETSLLVVGHCDENYKKSVLIPIMQELDIERNVFFHDYFEKQEDMFQYVKRARFALLPIKLDIISGTIIQAMRMGLPVITHITSGTPLLNKEKQCVLLSPIDDIIALAENMLSVYDESLAERLRQNAFDYCLKEDEQLANSAKELIDNCHLIVENYNDKSPIPANRLFHE